jgi:hypothetical protein
VVRRSGSAYDGVDFFSVGVQGLLAWWCCSLHGGGGGMRLGPERSPPWVVVKMTCSDNDLLGGGCLGMVNCIGSRMPSSTLLEPDKSPITSSILPVFYSRTDR